MSVFEPLPAERVELARKAIAELTERERTILQLAGDGLTAQETAAELGITRRTVEIHRSNILSKLGAKSIAQAMRLVVAAEVHLAIVLLVLPELRRLMM